VQHISNRVTPRVRAAIHLRGSIPDAVILRDIRARITEGLDTPDLQDADQLVEAGRIA